MRSFDFTESGRRTKIILFLATGILATVFLKP